MSAENLYDYTGDANAGTMPVTRAIVRRKRYNSEGREAWQKVFLEWYANTGNIRLSAEASNVTRDTVYKAQSDDKEFGHKCNLALADYADLLEAEGGRRAVYGTLKSRKLVLFQGEPVQDPEKPPGTPLYEEVWQHSDTLLLAMLKAKKPEYRNYNVIEHKGEITLRKALDAVAAKAGVDPQELLAKVTEILATAEAS